MTTKKELEEILSRIVDSDSHESASEAKRFRALWENSSSEPQFHKEDEDTDGTE